MPENKDVPLALRLRRGPTTTRHQISLRQLVIASWTTRDRAAMEGRLLELEQLGIPRPPSLPMFYRVAGARATTASAMEVIGSDTTGEAEFVLMRFDGRLWVGVGSDHTDRRVEGQSAALSKQLCCKPICNEFWDFKDIHEHWDALRLRSYVTTIDGAREAYQDGCVSQMLRPQDLLSLWESAADALSPSLLFCGTLPTIGSIRPASRFEFELEDPVLGRTLAHGYDVVALPDRLVYLDLRNQAQ